MKLLLSLCLLPFLLLAEEPTPQQLIEDLGAKNYFVRKNASIGLGKLGPETRPLLLARLGSTDDPEVIVACRALLENMGHILNPTPLEKLPGLASDSKFGEVDDVELTVFNRSETPITLVWIGFSGERDAKRAFLIAPGAKKVVGTTHPNHLWVIEGKTQKPISYYVVTAGKPKLIAYHTGK